MATSTGDHASLSVKIYTARADRYDDSFHPAQAANLISRAALQPGQHVLDLACGTGLGTFPAARAVGPTGSVTGIDVTKAMLDVAREKVAKGEDLNGASVSFHEADITKLDTEAERDRLRLRAEGYDMITVLSCLPLMKHPGAAIKSWSNLLAPNGRLMIDFPSKESQPPGRVFEDVAIRLGKGEKMPYSRRWVDSLQSLERPFLDAGLKVDESFELRGYGFGREYKADGSVLSELWEKWARGQGFQGLQAVDLYEDAKAKEMFVKGLREWARDGIIKEDDGFYIVIGRK